MIGTFATFLSVSPVGARIASQLKGRRFQSLNFEVSYICERLVAIALVNREGRNHDETCTWKYVHS